MHVCTYLCEQLGQAHRENYKDRSETLPPVNHFIIAKPF
jgi:hypothetical protein